MPNLNRVLIMGNLTRDPELRYLPSNTPVANFGVATNRRWRNQQGEQQEEVTFVDCEAFGKPAELINQYMRKGRPIFVEGRLKLDQWQDRDGNNRSKMRVVVENFQFIDSRSGPGDDFSSGGHAPQTVVRSPEPQATDAIGSAAPAPTNPPAPPSAYPETREEDIPF